MSIFSNSKLELTLRFSDGQSVVVSDKNVAKHAVVLVRAISSENPNWLTEDVVVSYPLDVPFPSSSGRFLLSHVGNYQSSAKTGRPATLSDYPEANECSLEELRDVIELANFLECLDFVQCIGFVIAQKLKNLSVDEIAVFMGVPVDKEEDLKNEGMGWPEAPVDYEEERRQ